MEETSRKRSAWGGLHLVQQDVHLERVRKGDNTRVIAEVECERRGCPMDVEQCARCPHFVRIEVHEAGYLLLCDDRDEDEPAREAADGDSGDVEP